MADTKITALTAITTVDPAVDVLPIVDVSDTTMAASGTTKKITSNQILGAGGTATLASATITGDLTVDTNVLKVDTTLNRVGIGTTSPDATLDVTSAGTASTYTVSAVIQDGTYPASGNPTLEFNGFIGGNGYRSGIGSIGGQQLAFYTPSTFGVAPTERYRIASDGVATWSNVGGVAGTAMTLNASGLTMSTGSLNSQYWYGINATSMISSGSGSWPLLFGINGSEKARIDSSGNLGIGVTPSAWASTYRALQIGLGTSLTGITNDVDINLVNNARFDGTNWKYTNSSPAERYRAASGTHYWYNAASGTAGNNITWTQAMTLDASGNLLIGQTASTNGNLLTGYAFNYNSGASQFFIGHQTGTASGTTYEGYSYNGTLIGSITQSGTTGVAFNATSDYRLKEAVQPITGALNRIAALKPSIYKWKVDGSSGEGFLAHELAESVPLAVTGEKDAVNEDGSIKPQQVDLSKVVPVLVAAIQELTARVQTLETR